MVLLRCFSMATATLNSTAMLSWEYWRSQWSKHQTTGHWVWGKQGTTWAVSIGVWQPSSLIVAPCFEHWVPLVTSEWHPIVIIQLIISILGGFAMLPMGNIGQMNSFGMLAFPICSIYSYPEVVVQLQRTIYMTNSHAHGGISRHYCWCSPMVKVIACTVQCTALNSHSYHVQMMPWQCDST